MVLIMIDKKELLGFPGYQVDTCGHIYGKSGRQLNPSIHKNGYYFVQPRKMGKTCYMSVHRAVALTFLDKPSGKDFVNHKDGDKSNNDLSNLEWVTRSENMKHSYHELGNRDGTAPMRGKFGLDHNRAKAVKILTPDGVEKVFGSLLEMTRETGFDYSSVSKMIICVGKSLPYTFKKGRNKGMTVLSYPFELNQEYYA